MAKRIYQISNKKPLIVQNGVEVGLIIKINNHNKDKLIRKNEVVSFRGFSSLYRTKDIFLARSNITKDTKIPIRLIYPFSENY